MMTETKVEPHETSPPRVSSPSSPTVGQSSPNSTKNASQAGRPSRPHAGGGTASPGACHGLGGSNPSCNNPPLLGRPEGLEDDYKPRCLTTDEPLVSGEVSLNELLQEFHNHPGFVADVRNLRRSASAIRRVRKDGCCFYRAFLFGLFEHLVKHKQAINQFLQRVLDCRAKISQAGYTSCTIDEFYEEFVECLKKLQRDEASISTVEEIFSDDCSANYLVVFARLLTSTHLKFNKDVYEPFITSCTDIEEFCKTEVDPMFVEAEQPQVMALTAILEAPIRVVCIDGSGLTPLVTHIFPEGMKPIVHLLYRPGHYDVLYPLNVPGQG